MFKDVVGYENYFQVNENGEVYSKRTGKILVQGTSKTGYKVISSKIGGRNGKHICLRIHRLVAEVFIPNLENKPFVNHIDGNKTNNSVLNLEWCTGSENVQHAYDTNLLISIKGKDRYNSVLTEDDVRKIRELYVPKKFGKRKIAALLNLPVNAVQGVCSGKTWTHIE